MSMDYVRPPTLSSRYERPVPEPVDLETLPPTPNRSPLDWSDRTMGEDFLGEEWAVTFDPNASGQVAFAFELLDMQLGEVEDRFVHLTPEGDAGLRMTVRRAETDGEVLPDVSSFAEVRRLRASVSRHNPSLTSMSAAARHLWREAPRRSLSAEGVAAGGSEARLTRLGRVSLP